MKKCILFVTKEVTLLFVSDPCTTNLKEQCSFQPLAYDISMCWYMLHFVLHIGYNNEHLDGIQNVLPVVCLLVSISCTPMQRIDDVFVDIHGCSNISWEVSDRSTQQLIFDSYLFFTASKDRTNNLFIFLFIDTKLFVIHCGTELSLGNTSSMSSVFPVFKMSENFLSSTYIPIQSILSKTRHGIYGKKIYLIIKNTSDLLKPRIF